MSGFQYFLQSYNGNAAWAEAPVFAPSARPQVDKVCTTPEESAASSLTSSFLSPSPSPPVSLPRSDVDRILKLGYYELLEEAGTAAERRSYCVCEIAPRRDLQCSAYRKSILKQPNRHDVFPLLLQVLRSLTT
jgi:hypothetical protein